MKDITGTLTLFASIIKCSFPFTLNRMIKSGVFFKLTKLLKLFKNMIFSFLKKFLNDLLVKQRFSLFYGKLQNNKIKSIVKKSKNSIKSNLSAKDLLVNSLENRLDTVLYRSHFVKSLREARLFIQHKHVSVNNRVITNNAFVLMNGDIITLSNKSSKLVKSNIYNSNLWPLPPEFLQINYSTLQISFIENLYKPTVSTLYPFWLDLNTIMNYYR